MSKLFKYEFRVRRVKEWNEKNMLWLKVEKILELKDSWVREWKDNNMRFEYRVKKDTWNLGQWLCVHWQSSRFFTGEPYFEPCQEEI